MYLHINSSIQFLRFSEKSREQSRFPTTNLAHNSNQRTTRNVDINAVWKTKNSSEISCDIYYEARSISAEIKQILFNDWLPESSWQLETARFDPAKRNVFVNDLHSS